MQTAHLRLLLKTHTISPIQAASHWQRHIQQYPHDTTAHRELTTLWLQAGQPAAAIQHLLRTPPKHLSPELRRLTAELAAQQKNQRALTTALQRLAEANEAPPPPTS
jgi:DNA-binding SARP family transcriptional activator